MDDYLDLVSSELHGEGRYKIEMVSPMPGDDWLISISDREDPVTTRSCLQSNIPLIQDSDIRSFLLRQLRFINEGYYDNEDI